MKNKIILILTASILFTSIVLMAHDGEDHHQSNLTAEQIQVETNYQSPALSEFPSLHPLVVHFPIVLLLLAPFVWLIGLWHKNELVLRLGWACGILGLITAYLAAKWIHPHTQDLLALADATLDRHDFWADMTLITAVLTTVLMSSALWLKNFGKKITTIFSVLALVLAMGTAISVSVAGHFGAALTHLYGIGPQGKFLEKEADPKHEH